MRIWHGGNVPVTAGRICTIRVASWQFVPSKWVQEVSSQCAAKRNTSAGRTPSGRTGSPFATGKGRSNHPNRGSATVPPITPNTTLCCISGWALGQRSGVHFFASIRRLFVERGLVDESHDEVARANLHYLRGELQMGLF